MALQSSSPVNPFDEHATMATAFPNASGRVLQDMVWQAFAVNSNKVIMVPYFQKAVMGIQ